MENQELQKKKQEIQEKYNKARDKWIQIADLSGKEYISLQERILELNAELKALNEEAKEAEAKTKK